MSTFPGPNSEWSTFAQRFEHRGMHGHVQDLRDIYGFVRAVFLNPDWTFTTRDFPDIETAKYHVERHGVVWC